METSRQPHMGFQVRRRELLAGMRVVFFQGFILVNGDGGRRQWIWGVVNSEKCDFLFPAAEVAEERGR